MHFIMILGRVTYRIRNRSEEDPRVNKQKFKFCTSNESVLYGFHRVNLVECELHEGSL